MYCSMDSVWQVLDVGKQRLATRARAAEPPVQRWGSCGWRSLD